MRGIGSTIRRILAGTALVAACSDSPTDPGAGGGGGGALVPGPGDPQPVLHLAIAPSLVTIRSGETLQLEASATSIDGKVNREIQVFWQSEDPGIAGVSGDGVVRGLHVGRTLITARWGTTKAAARITVLKGDTPDVACLTLIPGQC